MSLKVTGRAVFINSGEGLTKEVSIQRIKDVVKPPTRIQKIKRAFRQLNEPIIYPKISQ